MDDAILVVRFEAGPDGGGLVFSPGIGLWSEPPPPGALLGPGSRVGFLTCLNTRRELVVPPGVAGRVRLTVPHDRAVPVEFGQRLFELIPFGGEAGTARDASEGPAHGPARGDLPEGTFAVLSPTDGTFYRSPKPGAAAFVEVGSKVETGRPVGLVEVMKTFNRVLYGGPGLPDEARIVEVRCADAAEVHAGQILFVVR